MVNILNTDDIDTGVIVPVTNSDTEWFVTKGTVLASSDNSVFEGTQLSGVTIVVAGDLYAENSGVLFMGGSGLNTFTIAESGSITADSFGGVVVIGSSNTVTNNGEIIVNGNTGIGMLGSNNVVVNSGTISANFPETAGSQFSSAISLTGDQASVLNTGLLQNSTSGTATVSMDGTAMGTTSTVNYGMIVSPDLAYLAEEGDDALENGGTIIGDVRMGADNDSYRGIGDGVVNGVIEGNGGDDTLFGAALRDIFEGGNGDDSIKGRNGDDEIKGGGDDDLIRGGAGDDDLDGNSNSDTVHGGAGEDSLKGGSGSDNLRGGAGDDDLRGGSGSDDVAGGAGDDTVDGGAGRDVLKGGSGLDVFVFSDVSHSADSGNRDVIKDFVPGKDLIDLSGIADFTFIGGADFSGNGPEVRATTNASGSTVLRLDADGDGSSDSRIELEDFADALSASDFIF